MNLVLQGEAVYFELSVYLAEFLSFLLSFFDSVPKMASGEAPSEGMRLKIRPLLPEGEVPRGRQRDQLPKEASK